jgi:hypothetical protein
MASETATLTAEERSLLERLADRVVELRLEVLGVLTLETARPLSLIAGQAMIFFEPIAQALFRFSDYRTVASLVERREVLALLVRMIETRADEAHAQRRAARKPRATPPPAGGA